MTNFEYNIIKGLGVSFGILPWREEMTCTFLPHAGAEKKYQDDAWIKREVRKEKCESLISESQESLVRANYVVLVPDLMGLRAERPLPAEQSRSQAPCRHQ